MDEPPPLAIDIKCKISLKRKVVRTAYDRKTYCARKLRKGKHRSQMCVNLTCVLEVDESVSESVGTTKTLGSTKNPRKPEQKGMN